MSTIIVHKHRMRELAGAYWATASNLADEIVRETGISLREAHHVAGRLVRTAIEDNTKMQDTTVDMVSNAAEGTIGKKIELSLDVLKKALDPESFVKTRVTRGSCNPTEVGVMIGELKQRITDEEQWLSAQNTKLVNSSEKLDQAAKKIMDS